MRQRTRGTTSKTGMHSRRCSLTSSVKEWAGANDHNWLKKDTCVITRAAKCHNSLISVDGHLTFSLYSPSLHLLVLQARYFVICINSWAQPLSVLAIILSISPSCHDSFILVDSHSTFAHYFPSLHSLGSQDGYLIILINLYVHPPSLPAISIPHLHRYCCFIATAVRDPYNPSRTSL